MASPKITVWLMRDKRLHPKYVVSKVQNSLEPIVGQQIYDKDVQKLIDIGVTVNISAGRWKG